MFITTQSKEVKKAARRAVKRKQRRFIPPAPQVVKLIKTHVSDKKAEKEAIEEKKAEILETWELIKKGAPDDRTPHDFAPQQYYTHKKLIKKYPNKTWSGNRCFIIGGGPSLKGFDFSLLDGELTIAVNRAFEYIDPTIIFYTDYETFYKKLIDGGFGDEARKKFIMSRTLKIALNIGGVNYDHGTYSIPLSRTPRMTTDLKDGLFDGGNSGFGALNLAVCLEANPIYLLGFDMQGSGDGKQAWFHSGYSEIGSDKVYPRWQDYFKEAVPIIKRAGSQVINLNKKSALKCFEFGDIKKISGLQRYNDAPRFDSNKIFKHEKDVLFFEGAGGMGDNMYQRPVIKDLAKTYKKIYLTTAFPEAYWDIPNVEFVKPAGYKLRTQEKHMKSRPKRTWSDKPKNAETVLWGQCGPSPDPGILTKYGELENREDFDFIFPLKNEWIEAARKVKESLDLEGKKLCIIRRPTIRKEWKCPARNPKPEYYQLIIDKYKDEYFYLGLADIEKGQEWFDGKIDRIDKEFNAGEIPITTIYGLIKIADMTITYPSLFMIAAIAVRAKCFTIFGGIAGPDVILRRNLGLKNHGHVAPFPPCNCHNMTHDCKKDIPEARIIEEFEEIKNRPLEKKTITVGTPPGVGDSYWVLTKLESFIERHAIDKLKVSVHRDPVHYYTAELLKYVPFIDEVVPTPRTFQIGEFYEQKPAGVIAENTQGVDYLIDPGAKMWLENTPLRDILPEYETNYKVPLNLPQASLDFADGIKQRNKGKVVLFYTSSIGNNGAWNKGWTAKNWMDLLTLINEYNGARPIALGAEWDRDYTKILKDLDSKNIIQDYVGDITIDQTMALIKKASLIVGYACGLPMFGVYHQVPTVIFWSIKGISKGGHFGPDFQYTWAPPGTKESGLYFPVAYGAKDTTPKGIFEKIKNIL